MRKMHLEKVLCLDNLNTHHAHTKKNFKWYTFACQNYLFIKPCKSNILAGVFWGGKETGEEGGDINIGAACGGGDGGGGGGGGRGEIDLTPVERSESNYWMLNKHHHNHCNEEQQWTTYIDRISDHKKVCPVDNPCLQGTARTLKSEVCSMGEDLVFQRTHNRCSSSKQCIFLYHHNHPNIPNC